MTETLGAFAVLAWLAYLASRLLASRHLPELVGFLIVGAVLGPSGIELISEHELASLRPLTEIALAVLMFIIGQRVSTRALRAARWTLTTGVTQYVLWFSWQPALLALIGRLPWCSLPLPEPVRQ